MAQAEEGKEPPKEGVIKKIIKAEVFHILGVIDVFDKDSEDDNDPKMLTYVDFLDALVRVAASYPFGEREEYQTLEEKLTYVIEKVNDKFGNLREGFIKSLEQKDKDMNFVCKMVINDESDVEGEYDGEGEDDGDY